MDAVPSSPASLQRIRITLLVLLPAIPAVLLVLATTQTLIEPSYLTRDPLAVAAYLSGEGLPCCSRYLGALSMVGIIFWSATAATCILAALLISCLSAPKAQRWLLGLAGGLSTWLLVDDAFMLHEGYSPKLFGMIEVFHFVPMIVMLPLLGAILASHRLKGLAFLMIALVLLGTSQTIDSFAGQIDETIFIEDAFKLMGISLWTAYFVTKCLELVAEAAQHVENPEFASDPLVI